MYRKIEQLLLLLSITKIISIKSDHESHYHNQHHRQQQQQQQRCQPITYHGCKNIGYNDTYLPNKFNHQNQQDVALLINQFAALIAVGCSSELNFLLCSTYMPLCLPNYVETILPCREVCERVRAPCQPFYIRYNLTWPNTLECEQYPSSHENPICMDPKKETSSPISVPKLPSSNSFQSSASCCECSPSSNFHTSDHKPKYNCAPPCYSPYFPDESSKLIMTRWLTFLSLSCAISCAFVLLTFFIDITRFKYPQRPIIFLALCYFFVSCGYLLRLKLGHENVACQSDNTINSSSPMLLVGVSGPSNCAFVFVLTYFFGMASSIWWVILTLTWFLAAGFKWSSEAIDHYSLFYHLIAWLLPCLQTIIILMLHGIDGDPISGICYVGHVHSKMLRRFVVLPLILFLTIGTIFLLGGLISLIRIRNVMKIQDRIKTSKLEKLMVRIGLYAILYTVPATIVIGIYFYELRNRCNICLNQPHSRWTFQIYMAKYFFLLIVGITTGLWINLNSKTIITWKKFFCRCLCCKTSKHNHQYQYGNYYKRNNCGVNFSYNHTKINGSKYSLPSSKQLPLAHV